MHLAGALCSLVLLLPVALCKTTNEVHCLTKLTTKKPASVTTIHQQTTVTSTATDGSTEIFTVTSTSTPSTTVTQYYTSTTQTVSRVGPKYTTLTIINLYTTTSTSTTVSTTTVPSTTYTATTTTTPTSTVPLSAGYRPVGSTLPGSDYKGSNSKRDIQDGLSDLVGRAPVARPEVLNFGLAAKKQYPEKVTCITTHVQSTTTTTYDVSFTTVPADTTTKTKSTTTTTTQTIFEDAPTPRTKTERYTQTVIATQTSTQTTTSTVQAVATQTAEAVQYYPACDSNQGGIIDHIGNSFLDAAMNNGGTNYVDDNPTNAYDCCKLCLSVYQNPGGLICKLGVWLVYPPATPPSKCFIVAGNVSATGSGVVINYQFSDPQRYLALWNGIGSVWDTVHNDG